MYLTEKYRQHEDPDYLEHYWGTIDKIRKMIGKQIGWKADESLNLNELWNNVIKPLVLSQRDRKLGPNGQ